MHLTRSTRRCAAGNPRSKTLLGRRCSAMRALRSPTLTEKRMRTVDALVREAGFEAAFATDHASRSCRKPLTACGGCRFPAQYCLGNSDEDPALVPGLSGLETIMNAFFRLWLPVVAWAALYLLSSSIPHLRFDRKTISGILSCARSAYGRLWILARLLARALTGSTRWSWKKIFAASLVLSFLYACTDEFISLRARPVRLPRRRRHRHLGAWAALGITP